MHLNCTELGNSAYNSVRGLVPSMYLGHVHVVDEVDEFLVARRPIVASSLLLQRLLEHLIASYIHISIHQQHSEFRL